MFEDDVHVLSDPAGTLATLRGLGVGIVRVSLRWATIAPNSSSHRRPRGFDATNPAAYPQANWRAYDLVFKYARMYSIKVDLTLNGGAPLWATGPGAPHDQTHLEWKPSAAEFGKFVQAVGRRYSGHYSVGGSPLPRVSFWAIWNEPNFGKDLAPQAIRGSTVSVSPSMYRQLIDAAWGALHATGHGQDSFLIGALDARGASGPVSPRAPQGLPGNFSATKPLQFLRTLYCVDSSFNQLRGSYARARGCPATASGSRRFHSDHPGLFRASGFDDHPYPVNLAPNQDSSNDPDFATFNKLPKLERQLDRLQRIYGSSTRFPIWVTEYGYITNPPNANLNPPGNKPFVSPATAAYYSNWAEYLSWRSPRIANTMQYLLFDPNASAGQFGGFDSGLEFSSGVHKPSYDAYVLPLFLPVSSVRAGHQLELWGCVRPAHFAALDTGAAHVVQIQYEPGFAGPYSVVRYLPVSDPHGYFDIHVVPPSSGFVRLAWNDQYGQTHYSRVVPVSVH